MPVPLTESQEFMREERRRDGGGGSGTEGRRKRRRDGESYDRERGREPGGPCER